MAGKGKRKADDNLTGTRRPAARTNTTAGENLAGTSAQTSGPKANAAGDGIAGTSQALAGLTAGTTGSAGGSSQFGGAARGAGGGSGYRGSSQPQPHRRAPSQGMLRPPLGNPAGGRPAFTYQYRNQIAGPLQTGTGHSGSSGPSSAITSASAPGAPVPVSPLVEACPRCKRPPTLVFSGCAPFCVDCYAKIVLANVLQKHPEIRYVHPPPGAAAITPSSSSSSSSAVGSGPICPACGHPSGTGNRACSVCHRNGPPPPGLG